MTVEVDDAAVGGTPDDTAAHTLTITDVNEAPTVSLTNLVTNLAENTDTTSAVRIADIVISDDALGTNNLTLSGTDAGDFEIVGSELRLKAGTSLDFETKTSFDVTVEVDDAAVGGTPDDTAAHTLTINDVNEAPTVSLTNLVTNLAENTDTTSAVRIADIVISDDALGTNNLTLSGADAGDFEIVGTELRLKAGTSLDFETKTSFDVTVEVDDAAVGGTPDDTAAHTLTITDVNEAPTVSLTNLVTNLAENTDTTSAVRIADIVISDDALGTNNLTLSGADAGDFEIVGTELRLKAGTSLDFETKSSFDVTVEVDDAAVGGTPDDAAAHTLTISDVNEAPTVSLTNLVTNLAENTDTTSAVRIADIVISDDALGTNNLTLSGADAGDFEIVGTELRLKAGTSLDFETKSSFDVTVEVDDAAVGGTPDDTAAHTLTISDVNEAPRAVADTYAVNEGATLSVAASGVLANDVDGDLDTLSVDGLVTGPAHGLLILNADGSFTYTHDGSETTVDNFVYRVADGKGGFDQAMVNIVVNPVNNAPGTTAPTTAVTAEDTPLTFSSANGNAITLSDADAGANPVIVTLTAVNGTLSLDTTGLLVTVGTGTGDSVTQLVGTLADLNAALEGLTFDPTANYYGAAQLTIDIDDQGNVGSGGNLTARHVLAIDIQAVNDGPTGTDDAFILSEDSSLSSAGSVLDNDSDVDGDLLSVALATGPSHGALTLAADGSFIYAPDPDFSGTDSFTYRVQDGSGEWAEAMVHLDVTPVNDRPIGTDDQFTVQNVNALVVGSLGVLLNDLDIDGDVLSTVLVSGPASGNLVLQANGAFLYTPNIAFSGTTSFTYMVTDGQALSDPVVVTIEVTPIAPLQGTDGTSDSNDGQDTDNDESSTQQDLVARETPQVLTVATEISSDAATAPVEVRRGSTSAMRNDDSPLELAELDHTLELNSAEISLPKLPYRVTRHTVEVQARTSSGSTVTEPIELSVFHSQMWRQLEQLSRDDVSQLVMKLMVGTSVVASTGFTAGYVLWMARGGYLMALLSSSLPAWAAMDPLAVLDNPRWTCAKLEKRAEGESLLDLLDTFEVIR